MGMSPYAVSLPGNLPTVTANHADDVVDAMAWAKSRERRLVIGQADISLAQTLYGTLDRAMSDSLSLAILDTGGLNRIRDYRPDDLVITVEAGMTLAELDKITARHQQWLPLRSHPDTRLLDLIAENRPTPELSQRGLPQDWLLGLEVAVPSQGITHCGGTVVKNATGYDLNKLYCGAFHTLGAITAVTLRLAARPKAGCAYAYSLPDVQAAMAACRRLQAQAHRLPIAVCMLLEGRQPELGLPYGGEWHLVVLMEGDGAMLPAATTLLHELVRPTTSDGDVAQPAVEAFALSPEAVPTLWRRLHAPVVSPWNQLQVRLAAPPVRLINWLSQASMFLSNTFARQPILELDPLAGLVWLRWLPGDALRDTMTASDWLPALETMAVKFAEYTGGTIHVGRAPLSLLDALERVNLPRDMTVRGLNRTLKSRFDPEGLLWTPRLPL